MSKQHGGRRENQTGRPRLAAKRVRIGMLYLPPDIRDRLLQAKRGSERPVQTAARLLADYLSNGSN